MESVVCKSPNALYGVLKSALLFYKKLRADLESNGFGVNPYNPCVANKVIYGHQMIIVWHDDDKDFTQGWMGNNQNNKIVRKNLQ